jgi:hypothetical protein
MTDILILCGLPPMGFAAGFAFRAHLSKLKRRRVMKQYGSYGTRCERPPLGQAQAEERHVTSNAL